MIYQFIAVSKSASQRPHNKNDCIELEVGGEFVKQVGDFFYLGANISGDSTIDRNLEI